MPQGLCPHGYKVTKVIIPDDTGPWTHEQRPDACALCVEAVKAGEPKTLERYIDHGWQEAT